MREVSIFYKYVVLYKVAFQGLTEYKTKASNIIKLYGDKLQLNGSKVVNNAHNTLTL